MKTYHFSKLATIPLSLLFATNTAAKTINLRGIAKDVSTSDVASPASSSWAVPSQQTSDKPQCALDVASLNPGDVQIELPGKVGFESFPNCTSAFPPEYLDEMGVDPNTCIQPEFSFPVSAPVPSGFVDQAQIDPEPVSMEKRDIYAALRDIQGPSESEELPELEQPVFQAAPVNQNVGDEEDDDFGDFEEAKEIAISEQIQNQNFKKPAIPKVLSLDIQKFEKIARDTPSPSEPVYDPFALSFNAGEKQISQMAKTMSSDFDLLAGLDFGTPSEPVQPIEAPTTEDRLAQVLSLDLPDLH